MSARVRLPVRLPDLLAEPDRALVARFGEARDEAAFASLVRRHAGMVLGVCRRAVGDSHLAEDAFQAVFLVLARNPAAAARSSSVAGWLFGVARRVGLAARRHERRRAERTRRAGGASPARPEPDFDDLLCVLDEELAALPEAYRAPLIACFLKEQTQDEAARQLGWSLSTLRRRLDRGKELLRMRMTRRGATLSAGLLAAALTPSSVSAKLVDAAANLARGTAPASGVVPLLASHGVARPMTGKLAAAVYVVLLGGIATTVGWPDAPAAAAPVAHAPAPPVEPPQWVQVKGRVVFPEKRELPKRREILKTDRFVRDADHVFSKGRQFFEDVVLDPKTRGIKNVIVWLQPDGDNRKAAFPQDKIKSGLMDRPVEHVIDTGHFQFTPRVVAAKVGDTLRFKNSGPVPHNVHYSPPGTDPDAAERSFNVVMPPGEEYVPKVHLPGQRSVDQFRCNIHPWMDGYVRSFDHPYSAVTDADGNFTIADAPAGTWRLVIWHEKTGFKDWRQQRLGDKVTLTGPTDLGAIALESEYWDEKREE